MTIPPRLSLDQLPAATTIDTSSTTDNLLLLRQGNVDKKMSAFLLNGLNSDGDVHGPSSATDNALVRFDTTTGKLLQNSNATLDDAGNLNLGIALGLSSGGTGQTSFAQGDMLYASAINTLAKLPIGQESEVLSILSGVPTWQAPTGGDGILTLNSILPDVSRDFEISSSDNTVTFTSLTNGIDLSVPSSSPKVNFSVQITNSVPTATGDGTPYQIIFDAVYQTGNDYDLTTGIFTCSVPGLYQFSSSVGFFGLSSTCKDVTAYFKYFNLISGLINHFYFAELTALSIQTDSSAGCLNGSLAIPMVVGDTLCVETFVTGTVKDVFIYARNGNNFRTTFSGSN